MLSSIGPAELVVVLIIALLVLGPKRLPEAGRGLGRGIREFKDSLLIDHGPRDHGETNTLAETDTGRSIEIHAGGE